MTTPQVWIGCLAAYNGGDLHGKWVDAIDADEIAEAGAEVIKTSPADFPEELFIADYDGFPRDVVSALGEYPNYETVAKIATALDEHGPEFAAWLSVDDCNLDDGDLVERFEESYRGEWDSEEAFAEELISDCGWGGCEQVPDGLMPYLDMDMIVRDLFQHGPYSSVAAPSFKVYVFEDV